MDASGQNAIIEFGASRRCPGATSNAVATFRSLGDRVKLASGDRSACPAMPPQSRSLSPILATTALALAFCLPCANAAQWKWIGPGGVIQYSDQPPPAGIAAHDILQRPAAQSVAAPPPAASTASGGPSAAASQAQTALERKIAEKKQAAQKAKEDAQRLQQAIQAQQMQQNCLQAQRQLQLIDSGQRIAQLDAQGNRYFLSDSQRAAQRAQALALIAQYCR
jgi:hypothetical protein